MGLKRKNILITSKPVMLEKKHKNNRIKTKMTINVVLFCHPNHSKKGQFYLIPRVYIDYVDSFDDVVLKKWHFDKNDKRKVKRIKKLKNRLRHHLSGKSPVQIFKHILANKTSTLVKPADHRQVMARSRS